MGDEVRNLWLRRATFDLDQAADRLTAAAEKMDRLGYPELCKQLHQWSYEVTEHALQIRMHAAAVATAEKLEQEPLT